MHVVLSMLSGLKSRLLDLRLTAQLQVFNNYLRGSTCPISILVAHKMLRILCTYTLYSIVVLAGYASHLRLVGSSSASCHTMYSLLLRQERRDVHVGPNGSPRTTMTSLLSSAHLFGRNWRETWTPELAVLTVRRAWNLERVCEFFNTKTYDGSEGRFHGNHGL